MTLPVVNLQELGSGEKLKRGDSRTERNSLLIWRRSPCACCLAAAGRGRARVASDPASHCLDGWSMGILIRETATLYQALSTHGSIALSDKDWGWPNCHSIRGFCYLAARVLQGDVLKAQLDYWRQRLDSLAAFELPTDRPRPRFRPSGAPPGSFALPAALSESLRN